MKRLYHKLVSHGNMEKEPIQENDVMFESIFTFKCAKAINLPSNIVHVCGKLVTFTNSLIYHEKVFDEYIIMIQ